MRMNLKSVQVLLCMLLLLPLVFVKPVQSKAQIAAATITVDQADVINPDFLGIGAEYDPFAYMEESLGDGFNDNWWEMEKHRIAKLKPDIVRVWYQVDWMEPANDNNDPAVINWSGMQTNSSKMQAVYEVLDYLKSQDIDVMLIAGLAMTEENQSWLGFPGLPRPELSAPTDLAEWGEWVSATLQHLINTKGYTNIKYVMSYNEPNLASFATPANVSKPNYYRDMYQAIHNRLTADGIRSQVKLIGPDESGAANWTQYAVQQMDGVLDIYDGHAYGQDYATLQSWLTTRLNYVNPTGKPFMITEFAGIASPDSRKTYQYGVSVADLMVSGMRNNASALLYWRFADQRLPEPLDFLDNNAYGLYRWMPITATPNPSYYAFGLFSRYIESHSEVLSTESPDPDLHVSSVRLPDGNYSVFVVNSSKTVDKNVTINFTSAINKSVERHLYSEEVVPSANANLLPADKRWAQVASQFNDDLLPANSVAVYTTVPDETQIEIMSADQSVTWGEKIKFKACVLNGIGGVKWSVLGGPDYGTISNGGVYHAPSTMPAMRQAIIKATSNINPDVYSYAVVRFEAAGLTASGEEDMIVLNWLPSAGATGYTVKRSINPGGPYTAIAAELTETTYTDTDVNASTRYYYVVSAENAVGEIGNSRETFASPLSTSMQDEFTGHAVDTSKWTIVNQGLRSTSASALTASVADGTLKLAGTTDIGTWAGKSLRSIPTFRATPEAPLTVEVDRVSLDGSGVGFRSAVWLYVGPSQYIHFAQSGEYNRWVFNKDGSSDNLVWNDGDRGNHRMKMVHDGSTVKFYIDGVERASTAVTWHTDIKIILTGEACLIGDTVNAEFDNLSVYKGSTP
ncbi:glycosyl hydrolase [Paenibacillus chungangensis]|uniref:Glycosyl hydrolase n=1 Tax=Paenibacillus chungangensis TaxID=696535 RepID=A0ABW3HU01_9BACL